MWPDHRRALLSRLGVLADRLTATVLLYRVRTTGTGPLDRRLADSGVPEAVTLLDLTHKPPTFARQVLTVVENPSVLEAAMAADATGALACTSGYLTATDHALLQLAADQGLDLRYAGDLDPDGLRIATTVARVYGARLSAMNPAVIEAAAGQPSAVPVGPLPADIDPELAAALRSRGTVVFQEADAVLDALLKETQNGSAAQVGDDQTCPIVPAIARPTGPSEPRR